MVIGDAMSENNIGKIIITADDLAAADVSSPQFYKEEPENEKIVMVEEPSTPHTGGDGKGQTITILTTGEDCPNDSFCLHSSTSKRKKVVAFAVTAIPIYNIIHWGTTLLRRRIPVKQGIIMLLLSFTISILLAGLPFFHILAGNQVFSHKIQNSVVVVEVPGKDSSGTGFVVAKSADNVLVMTNRHVLKGKSSDIAMNCIIRSFSDCRMDGRLVAVPKDESIDLAIVAVRNPPDIFSPVTIGKFDGISPGDPVTAVGHPGGLEYTLTKGIVSARREGILIQHDAAIYFGNSGGPLYDENMRVIGVNTAMLFDREGFSIAFRADFIRMKDKWTFFEDLSELVENIKIK